MPPNIEGAQSYEEPMRALADLLDINDRKDQRRSAQALTNLYFDLTGLVSPSLFIEAGARDAAVSLRARKLLPGARIVAFEPSPFNVAHFKNQFDYQGNGIEYEQLALADAPGKLRLYVPRSIGGKELAAKNGLNSLLKRASADTVYDEIEVRAATLDDFFPASASQCCCVWIDVEGASGKVLSGGQRLLGQTQVLMIEVEDQVVWHGQWLVGDVLKFLSAIKLVPVARDFQWWPDNYNIVCVRRDLLHLTEIQAVIDRYYRGANNQWRKGTEKALSGRLLRASRKARNFVLRALRASN
jgi:FkbM family methyltransferase